MRWKRVLLLCVFVMICFISQKYVFAKDAKSDIKQVLIAQVSDWNKGDIDRFMEVYQNSPQTTFIGKTVRQGWLQVSKRYKNDYPTKQSMGTLIFSDLTIRMLGSEHAVVTGRYHLARNAKNGGDASGIFSLVWEKSMKGWKIILDHTSQ